MDDPCQAAVQSADRDECRRHWWWALLILGVTAVAYSSLAGAGWIWDDDDYVLNNTTLRSLAGLGRIWFEFGAVPQYYPLVHTTFWLEYQLWGLNPTGYHVVNLLLHGGAAITLARVVDLVLASPASRWWTTGRAAGLLFAVHPVAVESAAWITERKNVLSLLLALLALGAWWRWRQGGGGRYYGAAVGLFLAAMLSKTVVCSLPAVLLVLVWYADGRVRRRDWLAVSPMFLLGIVLAAVTVWMERHHVGAKGEEWGLSAADRIVLAGRALWFYAGKLVWPVELSFIYPRWQPDGGQFWQWAAPMGWLAVGGWCWRQRSSWGRGPLAGWLLYSGILVPALGFIDVYPFRYSFVADHFQYHAATVAMVGGAVLLQRLSAGCGAATRACPYGMALAVVACFVVLTWLRCPAFHDEEALWRDTLRRNPAAWIAHNNLGLIHLQRGEAAEAARCFEAAIALKKDHGNAWTNLGSALALLDRHEEARAAFAQARQLLPDRPDMWRIIALYHAGRKEHVEALAAWREILLRIPTDAEARQGAANALIGAGHPDKAAQFLQNSQY